MKVSIITLCRDTLKHMKNCFDYVMTHTDGIGDDIEWIIVDNDSEDQGMKNYFDYMSKYPGIKIIHNCENLSFAIANNQAVEEAKGDWIVFLNSDIIVTKHWLKNMFICREKYQAPVVGGRLYFPSSTKIQHAGIVQRDDGIFTHRFYGEEEANHPEILEEKEMPVTAAMMLINKTVFNDVDGFDERFVWGYEDVDLNLKLMANNHKIIYCPSAFAFHVEHGTDQNINKGLDLNIKLLDKKWNILNK